MESEIRQEKIICVDTETTGFDRYKDELLQLSIVRGDGQVLFNHYLRPTRHTEWEQAELINHISPEMVANEKPLEFYIDEINQILASAELIVGYNHLYFDLPFMSTQGITVPDETDTYDVMYEFARLYGEWDARHNDLHWFKLSECAQMCRYEMPETENLHNSLADAIATLYCYHHCVETLYKCNELERKYGLKENYGIKTRYIKEMLCGYTTKSLENRFLSGKYSIEQMEALVFMNTITTIPNEIDETWSAKKIYNYIYR